MSNEEKIMRIEVQPGMKNARLFVNGLMLPLSVVADILSLMRDAMQASEIAGENGGTEEEPEPDA